VTTTLDWSDPKHWRDGRALPCMYCGEWTPLLDNAGRPAHKTCTERVVDELRARQRREQAS
jgi:hypothetical protein